MQKQRARLLEMDAQPSAARIHLPEGAARKVSAPVQRAYIPETCPASGPEPEPGRILIPGDGAAGDQGLRIGLPARGDGGGALVVARAQGPDQAGWGWCLPREDPGRCGGLAGGLRSP